MPRDDLNVLAGIVQAPTNNFGMVRVRMLNADEMGDLLEAREGDDARSAGYRIIAACVVDELDKPVYASPAEARGVVYRVIKEVREAVWSVNGIGSAEKKSAAPAAESSASSSASPTPGASPSPTSAG